MGEQEAIDAIKRGTVRILCSDYDIIKAPKSDCEGCSFSTPVPCPITALNICSTGGNILKLKTCQNK